VERKADKTRLHVLAAVGVALGIAVVIAIRSFLDGAPPLPRVGPGNVPAAAPGPTVAEVVSRHLVWADEQASAGLAPQLAPIREFFAEARKGTRGFAEDALSFDSKWKFVVGYVAGGDEHRQYLEQRFAARVFAQETWSRPCSTRSRRILRISTTSTACCWSI
jgi:hypothetical protein